MRLRVEVSGDPSSWINPGDDLRFLREIIDFTKDHLLLLSESHTHRALLGELAKNESMQDRIRNLLSTLIEATPTCVVGAEKKAVPDAKVGIFGEEGFLLETILELESPARILANERANVMLVDGDSRSASYGRSLGILAPLARRAEILDRYAALDIVRGHTWLLEEFLKNHNLDMTIWADIDPDNRGDDTQIVRRIKEFCRKVDVALAKVSKAPKELEFLFFPSTNGQEHHDRRILFSFDNEAKINVPLDHGISNFSHDPLKDTRELRSHAQEEFTRKKALWERTAGTPVILRWFDGVRTN